MTSSPSTGKLGMVHSKSLHAFDVEDETESSRLINSGVEKTEKARQHAENAEKKKRLLIVLASVSAGLLGLVMVLVLVHSMHTRSLHPSFTCPEGTAASNYEHTFFVVGDWGRGGNDNQNNVARLMGQLGDCYQPSFVISTGDNMYMNGLKKENDPYFTQTFTNVYTQPSLQVPWYAVLGNHDYGELSKEQVAACSAPTLDQCPEGCCYSPLWQTNLRELDSRWTLFQGSWKQTFMGGRLDMFFIDTTPLINKHKNDVWYDLAGGLAHQNTTAQLQTLEALLASSSAQWKLVIGHHPVHSYGVHCNGGTGGDCVDMQFLTALMRKYKVAAYFCGHEHDLQLIKAPDDQPDADPIYYVVSGAGADVRVGEFDKVQPEGTDAFLSDQQGFVSVGMARGGQSIVLDFWIRPNSTAPVHSVTITRPTR